jgi:hypothetical protein
MRRVEKLWGSLFSLFLEVLSEHRGKLLKRISSMVSRGILDILPPALVKMNSVS